MKGFAFVAAVFLLSVLGFASTASTASTASAASALPVSTQGEAFSNEVTATTGETKIDATSSPSTNFAVDEVYDFDTADQVWKPCQDWEYAINPSGQATEHTCTFINGLVTGRKYKIKYSWVSSQVPAVTIAAS